MLYIYQSSNRIESLMKISTEKVDFFLEKCEQPAYHTFPTAGLSVRVRTGIHTFSPAVGRLEPIRDRLRAFQSEPHPALLEHIYETRKFTSCSPMINMISPPTQKCTSGFVSGSIVPFQRTYACPKASCFGREFAFFRRHFYRDPAARGSMAS